MQYNKLERERKCNKLMNKYTTHQFAKKTQENFQFLMKLFIYKLNCNYLRLIQENMVSHTCIRFNYDQFSHETIYLPIELQLFKVNLRKYGIL